MDLKPIYLLVSTLAIGAGVVTGWVDSRDERDSEPPPEEESAPGDAGLLDSFTRPERQRSPRIRSRFVPEDILIEEGNAGGGSRKGATDSRSVASSVSRATGATNGEAAELRRIHALIEGGDLERAVAEARRFAESAGSGAAAEAERLEARVRVLERLVPDSAEGAAEIYEVLLANRTRVIATKVEEDPERYRMKLASGAYYAPLREDVLEVVKADSTEYLEKRAREILSEVEGASDPLVVWEKGLKPCRELGLRDEAFRLAEKLLALPGSEKVARRLAPGDEDLLDDWRLAVAGLSGARSGATGVAPTPSAPTPSPEPVLLTSEEAQKMLGQVHQLVGAARVTYQNALGKDGREDELRQCLQLLRQAQRLLDLMPADPQVKELRREVSQLLSDVGRAQPFEG